jgi:hypothetical protein
VPIDAQDLEDYLRSKVPSFAEDMAAADQAHAYGETDARYLVARVIDRRDLRRAIDKL